MGRRKLFGSHLYTQIVAPLLVAATVVGLVATIVAVYYMRNLTDDWVATAVEDMTTDMVSRQQQAAEQMFRVTRFAADGRDLSDAATEEQTAAITAAISRENAVLGFDAMLVVDRHGRVVACDGQPLSEVGEVAIADAEVWTTPKVAFAEVGETPALVATHPITGSDKALISCYVVDEGFLGDLGKPQSVGFCLYADDVQPVVRVASDLDGEESEALSRALSGSDPEIERVVATCGELGASGTFEAGGDTYRVFASPMFFPGTDGSPSGHLIGVVGRQMSRDAGATTTNLITMWSMVAVIALVGLGGYIARRVSDPLVQLSDGARRIADGDFSTKVEVAGSNEVAELAQTFNSMTDSLRERTDALTKKVLELATLYEMSRSLGSTLDMDELLGAMLESALRIFDLELGYVALREKDLGSLTIRAVRGESLGKAIGPVRSSMSEWVVREGRPLIFNPDPVSASDQMDALTGAKAALCVPLVSPEGTIGSITIGSNDPDYRFSSDDVRLLSTIANHVAIAIGNIELFTSLQEAYLATVKSLAAAVDAKDPYTRGHSDRVAQYASFIAEHMGLGHEQRISLEMAAYLHDIGKIGVKEEILLKPGKLTESEMAQMRHHPLIGANILKPVAFPWAITPTVRHHHEYFDGTGYPAGLRGEEIPLLARILTVADSFEAMTADRPYRKGMGVAQAIEELRRCSGTQFDPSVVDVLVGLLEELQQDGGSVAVLAEEDIGIDEARAVFSALVRGLFASFRRLGGPRLASNVEREVGTFFSSQGMPFSLADGQVDFLGVPSQASDEELEQMRTALRRIDAELIRLSGTTLVDHFYTDALDAISARMRDLARRLSFLNAA